MEDRGPERRDPRPLVLFATFAVVLLVAFGSDGRLPQGVPASIGEGSPVLTGNATSPSPAVADALSSAAPAHPEGTSSPSPHGSTRPGPTSAPGQASKPTHAPTRTPGATTHPTNAPPGPGPTSPPQPPRPTPTPTPAPTPNPAPCPVFPASNVWNARVDGLPVRSDSATLIASIGLTAALHPDFSSLAWNGGKGYGIPVNKVSLSTPTYAFSFDYADESDPGPYPVPSNPKIEGGSDRHLILWDTEGCDLYEVYDAVHTSGGWTGGSGAIWNLRSNALRPDGWTSADAAGLPILPGLVRYDEVLAGAIRHALRFTAPRTRSAHIYPARHDAGDGSSASLPPMGLRVRLKADVDISGFGPQARVILLALQRYGMLLADNGSPWYVTGAPNAGWDDDDLHALGQLHGSDFEVVDTSGLR